MLFEIGIALALTALGILAYDKWAPRIKIDFSDERIKGKLWAVSAIMGFASLVLPWWIFNIGYYSGGGAPQVTWLMSLWDVKTFDYAIDLEKYEYALQVFPRIVSLFTVALIFFNSSLTLVSAIGNWKRGRAFMIFWAVCLAAPLVAYPVGLAYNLATQPSVIYPNTLQIISNLDVIGHKSVVILSPKFGISPSLGSQKIFTMLGPGFWLVTVALVLPLVYARRRVRLSYAVGFWSLVVVFLFSAGFTQSYYGGYAFLLILVWGLTIGLLGAAYIGEWLIKIRRLLINRRRVQLSKGE